MARNKHKLEKKDFLVLKSLLDAGVGNKKISEITGWSNSVIWQVSKSETYQDYLKSNRGRFTTTETNYTPKDVVKRLDKIISILEGGRIW